MKRDIRELFNKEVEETKHALPKSHREEFLKKLETKQFRNSNYLFYKIAAVLVVALTVSFFVLNKNEVEVEQKSPLVAQIEAVEKEYLTNIETEWKNFKTIATDSVLVKRYKKKLGELDADYQEISEVFKTDSNNILIVETLIDNLQTRLELLKDIQEHIKILNQKPRTL